MLKAGSLIAVNQLRALLYVICVVCMVISVADITADAASQEQSSEPVFPSPSDCRHNQGQAKNNCSHTMPPLGGRNR
jgi:hypothetical protein